MQINETKRNILIIDDEEDILTTCQSILEDEGYDVYIAKNSEESEEILKSKNINLVFLDVWLPNVDGLDILANIKKDYPEVSVIMMSGHAGVETAVRATKMGAYDFLEKPINISKLLSSCDEVLKNTKTENIECLEDECTLIKHEGKYKVRQRTIAKSIVVSGFALMEGRKTALTLVPAEVNTGIVFIDINTNTHIKLSHNNILSKDKSGAVNSTALVSGNRYIKTTEHFLAALHMMGITNLIVKCDGEVPNVDGSA